MQKHITILFPISILVHSRGGGGTGLPPIFGRLVNSIHGLDCPCSIPSGDWSHTCVRRVRQIFRRNRNFRNYAQNSSDATSAECWTVFSTCFDLQFLYFLFPTNWKDYCNNSLELLCFYQTFWRETDNTWILTLFCLSQGVTQIRKTGAIMCYVWTWPK